LECTERATGIASIELVAVPVAYTGLCRSDISLD